MSDAVAPRVRCCRVVCLCAGGVDVVSVCVGWCVRGGGRLFDFVLRHFGSSRFLVLFSVRIRYRCEPSYESVEIPRPASDGGRRDARAPRPRTGENRDTYRHMIHIAASRQFLATEVR